MSDRMGSCFHQTGTARRRMFRSFPILQKHPRRLRYPQIMGNSPLPTRDAPETQVAVGTLKRLLADHPFFRDWDDATLLTVAPHCRLLQPPAGAQCLALGDFSPFAHFLLAGEVHLCSNQGVTRALSAGSLDSRFPFARLRPSRYRVVAGEGTCMLKIESAALQRLTPRRNRARFAASDRTTGGTWRAILWCARFSENWRMGLWKYRHCPRLRCVYAKHSAGTISGSRRWPLSSARIRRLPGA